MSANDGVVGECIRTGRPHFVDTIDAKDVDAAAPLVCVPLLIKEHVLGVVLLYSFLQQKTELSNVDHEVLKLLAAHAATAIVAATLYADSTAEGGSERILERIVSKL